MNYQIRWSSNLKLFLSLVCNLHHLLLCLLVDDWLAGWGALASLLGHHTPSPAREATNLLNLHDNLRFLFLAEEVRQDLILRELLAGPPQLREVLGYNAEGSLLARDVALPSMFSLTSL
jgi:hypothetical protein